MADIHTEVIYTGNGTSGPWQVPFEYISKAYVHGYLNGAEVPLVWTADNYVSVPTQVGDVLIIRRITDNSQPVTEVQDDSTLAAADLNVEFAQLLHLAQEGQYSDGLSMKLTVPGLTWDARGSRIVNAAAPVGTGDVVPKGYFDDNALILTEDKTSWKGRLKRVTMLGYPVEEADGMTLTSGRDLLQEAINRTAPMPGEVAYDYSTAGAVQLAQVSPVRSVIRTGGYLAAGDGGGAVYKRVGTEPNHAGKIQDALGNWWELAEKYPDIRMFGAVCDGVADDAPAARACLDFCLKLGLSGMRGAGTIGFASTLDLDNLYSTVAEGRRGFVVDFSNATLLALPSFTPGVPGLMGKQPLIGVGRNSTGQQQNVRVKVGFMIGSGRNADGIGIGSGHPTAPLSMQNGAAGFQLELGYAYDLNMAVRCTAANFSCTENWWRGGIISGCNLGLLFDGPTITGQLGVPIVEAQYIHFGRIASCWWGGVVFLRKSRYSMVSGDIDANGQYISKLDIGTGTLPGFEFFKNVTGETSGATGEVLSRYSWRNRNYLLVMHNTSVVNNGSPFAVGEVVSNGLPVGDPGRIAATIAAIQTTDNGDPNSSPRPGIVANRFFYDVIAADPSTPFHRISITGPWLGGVIGNAMHTLNIYGGNQGGNGGENVNMYNDTHGWRFLSTGSQLTAYAVFDDNGDTDPFLEVGRRTGTDKGYFRPRRDLLLNGNKLFGPQFQGTATSGTPLTIWDVASQAAPENLVPEGKVWEIHVNAPGFPAVLAYGFLSMSATGTFHWHQVYNNTVNVTLNGTLLQAVQGAQPSMAIRRTAVQRV
ncbi:phage tail fiber protein [Inquilinus limosus]|uniref:phage tail fiber domain-containing protein n=1 Tax=Inquilinus limosus TaxID=171674 RepID=UPI00041395D7|nr:phage tail fiber protein [Inquilinus limosus]